MHSNSGGLANVAIVWGIASATGFVVMAALLVLGDWTVLQGLFAAAVIFFVLGSALSWAFLKPLPGPQTPGTAPSASDNGKAGSARTSSAPAAKPDPGAPAPAPAPAPAAASPAPAATSDTARPDPAAPAAPAAMPGAASSAEATPERAAEAQAGPGSRPATMDAPREGGADDLKKIKGVGPKLEELLHSMGFYHFDQIANWTADEVAWVDEHLEGFKGRVSRDNWVEQARLLASGGETDFSQKVDKGDVY